jgi:hypothetical protein
MARLTKVLALSRLGRGQPAHPTAGREEADMNLPKKDIIATVLVAAAVVAYLLWLTDAALPAISGTRVTGVVILGLGFAASAIAVVPSFDQLMHGNRLYLAVTSLLGLVAFIGGFLMLVSASSAALAMVIGAMVVLWGLSTAHHILLARSEHDVGHGGMETAAGRRL